MKFLVPLYLHENDPMTAGKKTNAGSNNNKKKNPGEILTGVRAGARETIEPKGDKTNLTRREKAKRS